MAEVAVILHFLGENVTWIAFAGDMKNLESFAMNPLANLIFSEFDVVNTFRDEIVGPVNTRLIVVVDLGGCRRIRKWLTGAREIIGEILDIDGQFGAFTCSINLGFAGA